MSGYKILAGTAGQELGERISKKLNKQLTPITVTKFSDGEIFIKIEESMRGKDVFYIQSTSSPANDNLIELLLTLDALKRSSAKSVTLIMPYFGYARQDRKSEPRVPISAKAVADMIESIGIDRLITLDIHADQIQGFFNSPVDNLYGANIFLESLSGIVSDDTVIASPDAGGVTRARYFAKKLGVNDIAVIDKRREKANHSEVMNVLGDVNGKDVIIIDDMVDTAGTLIKAAQAFKDHGAKSVKACITHGVLSGKALENIENGKDDLDILVISDSIPLKYETELIKVIDSSFLFSEVIRRVNNNESITSLFK